MRASVLAIFPSFTAYHEGPAYALYCDKDGRVTWGLGRLCDPIERAYNRPLRSHSGKLATPEEIRADFDSLTRDRKAAAAGSLKYAYPVTVLRSTKEDIVSDLQKQVAQNDQKLTERFPEFQDWPADAQLAILSLSWAAGTGFAFPKLESHLRNQDFLSASKEVSLSGGYAVRNADNIALLEAAAKAKAGELDPNAVNAKVHTFAVASWPNPPPPGSLIGGSGGVGVAPGNGLAAGILGAILLYLLSRGKRR